jgi:hypothetical protein
MTIDNTLLAIVASIFAKHAKFNLSNASMLACEFATELRGQNVPEETVNEFFNMFARSKRREGAQCL